MVLNVINLFGGPGCGKSTVAAEVFAILKKDGYDVELITEYAKSRVYEDHASVFADQMYMFAKQLRQFHRLEGKVDFAVCDSPLLLSVVYAREHNYRYDKFEPFVFEVADHFNNMNFYLHRGVPYNPNGRVHTLNQAQQLDKDCEQVLKESGQVYNFLIVDRFAASDIAELSVHDFQIRQEMGITNPPSHIKIGDRIEIAGVPKDNPNHEGRVIKVTATGVYISNMNMPFAGTYSRHFVNFRDIEEG